MGLSIKINYVGRVGTNIVTTKVFKEVADLVEKKVIKAAEQCIDLDEEVIDAALHPFLEAVRDNLIKDTFNELPENRSGNRFGDHYITGELHDSVAFDSMIFPESLEIEAGYYADYGLNLEEGGGDDITRAYPIIMPLWEEFQEDVSDELQKQVMNKFSKDFTEGF